MGLLDGPAFLAFELKRRHVRLGWTRVLVLEPDPVGVGRLPAGPARFDLALVQPALVDGSVREVRRGTHLMPELELVHEAVVRFAERPAFADKSEGLRGCDTGVADQVGAYDGRGAGFAHCTEGWVRNGAGRFVGAKLDDDGADRAHSLRIHGLPDVVGGDFIILTRLNPSFAQTGAGH